jgi:hypothetical protein
LFIYAESQDQGKAERAIEIIQNSPVISTQVINETVVNLAGFTLSEDQRLDPGCFVSSKNGIGPYYTENDQFGDLDSE